MRASRSASSTTAPARPPRFCSSSSGSPRTTWWRRPTPPWPRSARSPVTRPEIEELVMTDRLAELSAAGVAVWLDDLSRVRLTSGSLDRMRREQHVVGVTTNPSIFQKALSDADAYDAQVNDL